MKQITQFILEGRSPTLTARAGLQRPYNQILLTQAIYQFCSKNIENISFNLIEGDTLNLLWDKLACRYEHGETVSGTCSYHQFCPILPRLVINELVMTMTMQVLLLLVRQQIHKKVLTKFLPMNMLHVITTVAGGLDWLDWCRM